MEILVEDPVLVGLLFGVYVMLAVAVSNIAKNREIGAERTILLSFFLTPVVGLLVALRSKRKHPDVKLDQDAQLLFADSNRLAKENQREQAIAKLKELLAVQPTFAPGHSNLACHYSRLGRADESFRSLAAAIRLGYTKVNKIQSDPDLAFLRSQRGFAAYAASGYPEYGSSSISQDVVTKLERLASLKERGILTDAEFSEQKNKILKGS